MADTLLNSMALISLFDKGRFLIPLVWLVAFSQVSARRLFLLPAEQRSVAMRLMHASLMPNASVCLPVAVVIDWSNVMLHSVYFPVGLLAPNTFLQSWAPYMRVWVELLLLHPSGAYGPWLISHIASLCLSLWEGWNQSEGKVFISWVQWRCCDPNCPGLLSSVVFPSGGHGRGWCPWFLR